MRCTKSISNEINKLQKKFGTIRRLIILILVIIAAQTIHYFYHVEGQKVVSSKVVSSKVKCLTQSPLRNGCENNVHIMVESTRNNSFAVVLVPTIVHTDESQFPSIQRKSPNNVLHDIISYNVEEAYVIEACEQIGNAIMGNEDT